MSADIRSGDEVFRLGVIGDLHNHWDDVDLAQFARSDYDLLFFTGDLGGGTPASSLRIARSLSRLQIPTLIMPGNHDTCDLDELGSELVHQQGLSQIHALARNGQTASVPIRLCGYSSHTVRAGNTEICLIAGRPHSLGGPEFSFPEFMLTHYGIDSLEGSAARLCELVDNAPTDNLIFLAHNGPLGLGGEPDAMWGCDFQEDGGDWGDSDLARAMDHARSRGRRVLGMIGGHMHLRTMQGVMRPWKIRRDGTLYVNASLVPRIFADNDTVYRHHVSVTIDAGGMEAREVLVPGDA
jgi:uncharacterized protein (TIGR04168 family)